MHVAHSHAFAPFIQISFKAAGEPAWMDVLVDILLSLLGRAGDALPFHPLREASEALFRAFAEQVTAQGLADLLRVVQQTSQGPNEDNDDQGDALEEEEGSEAGASPGTIKCSACIMHKSHCQG